MHPISVVDKTDEINRFFFYLHVILSRSKRTINIPQKREVTTNDGEKDICLGIEHMLTDNIEINVEFYHFVSQL